MYIIIIIIMLFPLLTCVFFDFHNTKQNEDIEEERRLASWRISAIIHITLLLSLHLLGCTVCLRNRLLSAPFQASNRQNHCRVRNKG